MKNKTTLRTSIHSDEQVWLRSLFTTQRNALGLSQKGLADKMGVIASFIGKVETGDRRLDVVEFLKYCKGLELNPNEILINLENQINRLEKNIHETNEQP